MNIDLSEDALTLSFEGLEQLWAVKLTSHVRIPRAHVKHAENLLPPTTWKELRAPGTFLPGVIKAGTYYNDRGKELWYATRSQRDNPLTIELEGEGYDRLVLTLPDSARLAERINAWVGRA